MNQPREHETAHLARGAAGEIRADIDRTLQQRSAAPGTRRSKVEDRLKRRGAWAWRGLKKRPSLGVAVAGGLALLAADAVGVGELLLAMGVAYAAYQVLRKGTPADEALLEGEEMARREPLR